MYVRVINNRYCHLWYTNGWEHMYVTRHRTYSYMLLYIFRVYIRSYIWPGLYEEQFHIYVYHLANCFLTVPKSLLQFTYIHIWYNLSKKQSTMYMYVATSWNDTMMYFGSCDNHAAFQIHSQIYSVLHMYHTESNSL